MKLQHKKLKNTALIYEQLLSNIAKELFEGKGTSNAYKILRKHFSKNKLISEEVILYRNLLERVERNDIEANLFLEATISAYKNLDNTSLDKLRYNLVKDISKHYNINEFMKAPVNNYKELASAYKVLNYAASDSPKDYMQARTQITECYKPKSEAQSLLETSDSEAQEETSKLVENLSPQMLNIAYKLMIRKFNDKYDSLNESQKFVINTYLTKGVKEFTEIYIDECKRIIPLLEASNTPDTALNIKIQGLAKLIEVDINTIIQNSKVKINPINESQITNLLRYIELAEQLAQE